ncbi:hypothetical protein FBR02_04855 [Anaerolineae bacterium CFX9]|jgi:hypothetical protein|nr:hypothetical protein [Geitlerinema splendidum]MDL1900081.1 hypothetical protein [Anaerolineae bacterium CFX9]
MREGSPEDLSAFIRYNVLDAYELTDEEIARMLEVWRWSVWRRRAGQAAPDRDVREATQMLQRHLAKTYDVEVEYNTAFLLKQEIEPLMIIQALTEIPGLIRYCLRPGHWPALIRACWQRWRYQKIAPAADGEGNTEGYPQAALDRFRGRAPNILKRHYWRQISAYTYTDRKRLDQWW